MDMSGKGEGEKVSSAVRRVKFLDVETPAEGIYLPVPSPEIRSLAPRVPHTPITFCDDPKSPDPSPRVDAVSSPEVGGSPDISVKLPKELEIMEKKVKSPSVGEDMTSFVESFMASVLEE